MPDWMREDSDERSPTRRWNNNLNFTRQSMPVPFTRIHGLRFTSESSVVMKAQD